MPYILDSRQQESSFYISQLELNELRLYDQADLLWLLLIPRRENIIEIFDLTEADQILLIHEISFISQLIKKSFFKENGKINIAMLGNMVPQLHVHIMLRWPTDPYFPQSALGIPRVPYALTHKNQLIKTIRERLNETPSGF